MKRTVFDDLSDQERWAELGLGPLPSVVAERAAKKATEQELIVVLNEIDAVWENCQAALLKLWQETESKLYKLRLGTGVTE